MELSDQTAISTKKLYEIKVQQIETILNKRGE